MPQTPACKSSLGFCRCRRRFHARERPWDWREALWGLQRHVHGTFGRLWVPTVEAPSSFRHACLAHSLVDTVALFEVDRIGAARAGAVAGDGEIRIENGAILCA